MAICLPGITITEAVLTSSTAAEPGVGEQNWTSDGTFAKGEKAILGAPSATVTMTIAAPAVITWTANGLPNDTPVVLSTTGSLPTGLTAGTVYYVVDRTTNTFRLSETPGGAPITTTGSQSGTHTATAQIHTVFESQVDSNTGNPPAIDDQTKWIPVGPTNRWAMLDLLRSSKTWAASPLTVVLTPGQRIDTLFLGGLVADEVTLTIEVDSEEIFTETRSLYTRQTLTWSDYFFRPIERRASALFQNLPPVTGATITVEIARNAGLVGCASLVMGQKVYLGLTQAGAEADAKNFSKFNENEFGDLELVRRRSVPTVDMTVLFDKARSKALIDLRDRLNAVPAVWSGLDDDTDAYFEPVLILGIYTKFRLNLAHPEHGILSASFREI